MSPEASKDDGPYAGAWRRYRFWSALSLVAVVTMVFIAMPAVVWRGVSAGGVAVFFGFGLLMAIPLNMVKLFRCPRCHAFFDFWWTPVWVSKCSSCGLPKGAVSDSTPGSIRP